MYRIFVSGIVENRDGSKLAVVVAETEDGRRVEAIYPIDQLRPNWDNIVAEIKEKLRNISPPAPVFPPAGEGEL